MGEGTTLFMFFWSLKIIPKVHTIGWKVFLDKLPTKVNLYVEEYNLVV